MTAVQPEATAALEVTHKDLANAIRALSMDAVEQARSGHPGMPLGMALNHTNEQFKRRDVDPEVSDIWYELCGLSGQRPCINSEDVVFIAIRSSPV